MISYLKDLSIYPDFESNKLEFKTNLVPGDKILVPICAFLNSGGGYIILGIDDTTRAIKGIDKSSKEIDEFILNIDTIYHVRKIVTDNCSPLIHTNVQTQLITQKDNKPVIIISVTPSLNTQYQLADGNIYYRVNASNWKINSSPMYTEHEMQTKVHHVRTSIMKDCKNLITYLQNQNSKYQREIETLTISNNKLNELLFNKILDEKSNYECEYENINKNTFSYFCCFFYFS